MYNKQVIDYAECLLRHKQAQQEQAQITPTTIDVIEDEQGGYYGVNSGVTSDVNSDGDGNDES